MKRPLLVLLLIALASAGGNLFTHAPTTPSQEIINQVNIFVTILVPLMLTMIVISAVVYVVGQMFGAETRAKATIWAQGMLVAVGVSAIIIGLLYAILPGFLTGNVGTLDVVQKIIDLRQIAQEALIGLTFLLLILSGVAYVIGQLSGAETRARAVVWATGLLSGAIVASVLYVVLFQILTQLESTFFSDPALGLYGFVVIQITFFVAFFILITYLLSKVFKVPEWEAYLSIEMSNLLTSFLLVLFILGLFGAGKAVAIVLTGGSYSSPPQAAIAYMRTTVADSALRASIDVYKIQACTSILSTISRRIGEYVLTQTYKVFPGIDTFVSITNVLGMSLITLYNTAAVQVSLLYLVDALMVPFFLPAGLILRFFPPTRDAGAFLIALAFGFYVVFPTSYLINKEIYDGVYPNPSDRGYTSPRLLIQSLCGPFKYGVAGFLFNPAANPLFGLIPGGAAIGTTLQKIISEGLLNAISMAEFIPIMRHIASLSLLALFMPALAMMITIAFINSMTKFIVAKV
ncbi:MAG: hypothetical protein U0R44_03685 [Candidatus Micrarchaeia archaeon]